MGGDYVTERGGEYGIIRRERRKPLVAAVEGFALGGGLEIVLACDLVVASTSARFGLPEVKRGVVPTCGALFRGPCALPVNLAREMVLTGDPIDAARAYAVGFVNLLAEPGDALDRAVELAGRLCSTRHSRSRPAWPRSAACSSPMTSSVGPRRRRRTAELGTRMTYERAWPRS